MQELQGIVSRAVLQSPQAAQQLPEEVFWFARQAQDRLKWNLLSPGAFPWLKPFLRRCTPPAHPPNTVAKTSVDCGALSYCGNVTYLGLLYGNQQILCAYPLPML